MISYISPKYYREPAPLKISALPSGNYNGSFNNLGSNANFWTSIEYNSNNAYNRNLDTGTSLNSNNNNKTNGYSIRLVKDTLDKDTLYYLLYKAYKDARKHKRNTKNQLQYEINYEHELWKLADELINETYIPKPSSCFINELPVKREVIAADFRDRIVHHLLCSWLFPIFEHQFIYDSYSCRKNKGTLFGITRARKFIRSASADFKCECWSLRLDIKSFFMHIDKRILYELIIEGLNKANWKDIPSKSLCQTLVKLIVFANPIDNAIFRSPPESWNDLPSDKSLINNHKDKGLPIGNLTSQLFANIYLNPLDQFIKRTLKVKYYGRYVDDIIIISNKKSELLDSIGKIRGFLDKKLLLTLHPKKIKLQLITHGFTFLGAYILPYRVYPSRKLRKNLNLTNDITKYQSQLAYLNGTNC